MRENLKNEWAPWSHYWINGCAHDCKYCYSKTWAIDHGQRIPSTWSNEEVRLHDVDMRFKKYDGCIELPHNNDISPQNLDVAMKVLGGLLACGNQLVILSKPHLECVEQICRSFEKYKDNIVFRFTMGSSDFDVLRFWEPYAPDFDERKECLRYAFTRGFRTSVGCEPMLDDHIEAVVNEVDPFVSETIWIGKANALLARLRTNGHGDQATIERARALMESQQDRKILALYNRLKDNPKIRWKGYIKKIVGLPWVGRPGEDVF